MSIRTVEMSRMEDGGNSNEKSGKGQKVKIKSNISREDNSGRGDPLKKALVHPQPKLPMGGHPFNHGKNPVARGANYHPEGEFGVPHGPQTAATSMTLHFNNPGQNALGAVMNTVGQSALRGAKPLPRGTFRGNP